ncbi:hypothetical protein BDN72DRAFT_119461 [Pluteus cervinus]|uniref:Uncharacterized protein n=1 Tax=Pluteus cervinus TaxID=181527 RepID=A0ACD3B846_9AGAR|nr:hypothetical protein BDN72DRAFT_119461 [Pluteus cervinus]
MCSGNVKALPLILFTVLLCSATHLHSNQVRRCGAVSLLRFDTSLWKALREQTFFEYRCGRLVASFCCSAENKTRVRTGLATRHPLLVKRSDKGHDERCSRDQASLGALLLSNTPFRLLSVEYKDRPPLWSTLMIPSPHHS